jgi:acyl-CoA hydrolase
MNSAAPCIVRQASEAVSFVRQRLGHHWVMGAPLGLGKPNHLVNALYRAAKADPNIRLELFTALSLNPPKPATGLKQRFLGPFLQRHFGDYPRLEYLQDLDRRQVPPNIHISEFYFRSGTRLGDRHAQQHYLSSNYTHVARDMQNRGVNLIVQMVAQHPDRPGHFSLSCNPDVTLDLLQLIPREQLLILLQVNDALPYMGGAAEISATDVDLVLEGMVQPLFAVPRMAVDDPDLMIGLHTSQLIRDGGTLQLGIGTLGDAVSFCSLLRQQKNNEYRQLLRSSGSDWRVAPDLVRDWGGCDQFEKGLYAASEMLTEGFLHLYQGDVLKRQVYDHAGLQRLLNQGLLSTELGPGTLEILWQEQLLPRHLDPLNLQSMQHFGILSPALQISGDKLLLPDGSEMPNDLAQMDSREALARQALGQSLQNGALLHAAFFLGSKWMYQQLCEMPAEQRELFQMTAVSRINQLYRGEELDRAQRLEARFINTTMKITLLGAAVSDQLEDGQVVSGVGGQYNFVAMGQALDRARSILMLRSHRGIGRKAVSNIVWEFPHNTIPRHLRDIVVTEYGAADLRSKEDHEVIQALICIADSRWQESLRQSAIRAGKLDERWVVPLDFRDNNAENIQQNLAAFRIGGLLPEFPFGSDFTPVEQRLTRALEYLQEQTGTRPGKMKLLLRSLGKAGATTDASRPFLQRMDLDSATSQGQKLERRLLCLALKSTGLV